MEPDLSMSYRRDPSLFLGKEEDEDQDDFDGEVDLNGTIVLYNATINASEEDALLFDSPAVTSTTSTTTER